MLQRILKAIIVWVVVAVVCWLIGSLITAMALPVLTGIGAFLSGNAGLIGFLCALVYFFFYSSTPPRRVV
jgi:hypothetical protein